MSGEGSQAERRATISVVIVNWNSRADVLAAVTSLRPQLGEGDSLVVVDNGSTDGSLEALGAEAGVRLIPTGENLGFAEGVNRGIDAHESEWVLLFNNDAVAHEGFVAALREVAAIAPEDVGSLQPLLVFAQDIARVNSTGVVIFATGRARDRSFADRVDSVEGEGEPFCATGGAALYRRSMLEVLRGPHGYLDRRYFMYFEDVDLGWRARLAGYRTSFVKAAVAAHRFQGSSRRRGQAFVALHALPNRLVTLLKNGSRGLLLRTVPATVEDLWKLGRVGGVPALAKLLARLPGALRDRAATPDEHRARRADVESVWLSSPQAPTPPWDPEASSLAQPVEALGTMLSAFARARQETTRG